jgi:hypothetical protein
MDESKIQKVPQKLEEQEIDLIELAQKVWADRKMLYKVCGIAAVIGLIVGFSIPKEYSTEVTLAPESASKVNAGSMGALAAMAGINLGGSVGEDALSPELYPDIVKSTPFLLELFDVKVKDQKGKIDTTHIIISHHIALFAFLQSLNKSFTNNIQPTHPTPAKNTKPIRIIILLGLAARKGTVAGCTTVYTGVISCTLALAICNCPETWV